MSRKIILTKDESLVKSLEEKLKEYKERVIKTKALNISDDVPNRLLLDAMYKSMVLESLLDKKQVDVEEITSSFSQTTYYDPELFENAIDVIEDYNNTGGKSIAGGTGLKNHQGSHYKNE